MGNTNNIKVLTTGTFDVLHYGHINLLKRAKELGDYLIVGLNVTKNGQPTYYPYVEREKMLNAIKYVDEVVPIYKQDDKYMYLKQVDIFAIGSDYIGHPDIDEIQKYSKVVFIDRTPNISTTQIKQDMVKYKRIVVDVDETLCDVINRDFANAIPHRDVIDKVNTYYDAGYEIIISTARGQKSCKTPKEMQAKYYDVTKKWLDDNGVKYHKLDIGYKQNADLYVDDKAITPKEFVRRRVP